MEYTYQFYAGKRKRFKVPGVGEEIIGNIHFDIYKERPHTIPQIFQSAVRKDPSHEALVFGEQRISYGALAQSVNSVAFRWKEDYGVRKGDRIMLLLRNNPEFVISFMAASQIGAISVPTNTRLKGPEIDFIWNDCRPKLVIVEPELWDRIKEIKNRPETLEAIFINSADPVHGACLFSDLITLPVSYEARAELTEEDVNSIIYTSGTTGPPKGAMLCHRNLIVNSLSCQSLCPLSQDERVLVMAPLFHVTGLNSQLIKVIHAGVTAVLMRAFKVEDILDTIEREKITEMSGVPAMFQMMLDSPTIDRRNLSLLRYCGYGGAPAPVELIRTLKKKFPAWRLRNVYGMTEGASWVTMLPHEQTTVRPDSVGLPVPVVKLRVVDSEGTEIPPGEVGEILIQGPNVFKGYWENPQATENSLKDGWFFTGDLGRFDDEGFLYVVDRKKDMLIRGGENVYCIEVENVLYQHPKIAEAAVTGAPDPVYGEVVKAVVALKPGLQAGPEEIQEFCKTYLADYKIPKYVTFVNALPRNAGGKVIKKAL